MTWFGNSLKPGKSPWLGLATVQNPVKVCDLVRQQFKTREKSVTWLGNSLKLGKGLELNFRHKMIILPDFRCTSGTTSHWPDSPKLVAGSGLPASV